ncbi:MAG TPA: glycosyltransferase, partial [Negativicutes bacterium]
AHLCRAIELKPDFKEADFALGILYLLQGQYDKGWKRYELRRQIFDAGQPEIKRWQVENLAGCKILLYHEQGFGDTIHFARYIQEIAKVASQTVLLVPQALERLLSTSLNNITIQVDNNVAGEYDFSCPLPSLPFMFNTTLHTILQAVPYIKASYTIINKWHNLLEETIGNNNYKIGIVWAGNPNHKNDKNRSIPFTLFKQIFSISTVSWISLQVDQRAADLATIPPGTVIDFYDKLSDFAESAGLIENINLVITVDTAVAHLAGAMGKETWLLLPVDPDWRWLATGQDSLWYPTIRIFRQQQIGDWQELLAKVKVALEAKLKEKLII